MKLREIAIVFVALTGTICSTETVIRSLEEAESFERIGEATANILASCYGNEKLAIGLYGNFSETFIETLWSRKIIPIISMNAAHDNSFMVHYNPTGLNVVVILAIDGEQFAHGLFAIMFSRFFNRRASYLVVNWSPTGKRGCHNIEQLFSVATWFRILNVNVLCLRSTKEIMIFGYNPHTNQAPAPWQFVKTEQFEMNLSLTVFERKYNEKGICKNLDFDKANDLGGSLIIQYYKSASRFAYHRLSLNSTTLFHLKVASWQYENIVSMFIRQVNGTRYRQIGGTITFIDFIGGSQTVVKDNSRMGTYPCMQEDVIIFMNFKGYKSQLQKILTVVDFYSRCGTCLVLLVTLIFFKFVVRQPLIPAFLNIVRTVCNTGFENIPENNAARIYLTGILFFIVTIQGIFSGNLAALLTRNVPVKHPMTIQELLHQNYTIYSSEPFRYLFNDPMYTGRVVILSNDNFNCTRHLLNDPSAACMDLRNVFMDIFSADHVPVSNFVFHQYLTLSTDFDWYLTKELNKVLLAMTEAQIVDTFEMRLLRNRISYVEPLNEDPKVMTLNDLGFAFVILGIGLGCATVTFIVEISIKPVRSAVATVRRKLSNCFRKLNRRKSKVRKFKKTLRRVESQD